MRVAASLAAAGLVTVGCAGDGRDDTAARPTAPGESTTRPPDTGPASPSTTPATTSPSPRAPAPPEASPPASSRTSPSPPAPAPVTLAFAGDIHFEGELRARLDDPADALAPAKPALSAADLTVANLETSIGDSGRPAADKRYTFQAPPSALRALASAGVDVATMANNHGLDFGAAGLADTLAAADDARTGEPAIDVVGIGRDTDDAFAPALHEVGGTTVAVLGASLPDDPTADPTAHWAATASSGGVAVALDPARLLAAVRHARDTADVVAVYLHWGVQGERCPSDSQRDLASALAGAGADVVVGSHAHRLQGAGTLDGTYVAYGLGNFAWYTQSPTTSPTGVLTVTADGTGVTDATWTPARIGSDGLPDFVTGADAEQMSGDFASLRSCTDLRPLPDR
ncbi:poly-gamma-glutamate synthesis protein (capsule biosynthesis protein) [Haloactinopolyspora alba]|uniref:Poly-gamma-glutamate synthesis protein (Capsule biosynthesis protein) n=1 Tax=Haloactinopolyspora alba TaxID=648780 RepID=A0A2P8E155_9ACTN|nr:poly-gamma-glutamate synthesis protein (capsule biosynthesis protein) [Haloactinopolyspora alba]